MGAAVGVSLYTMKSHPTLSSALNVACASPPSLATRCSWMASPTRAFCRRVRLKSSTARVRLVLPRNAAAAAAAAACSLNWRSRRILPLLLALMGVTWVMREGSQRKN